jgi:hypothetical protein
MSSSARSNVPASAPCSINTLISSSVTGASANGRTRRSRRTKEVESVSKRTTGEASRANAFIGSATMEAMRSGLLRAMRLGTSSPRIRDR